MRGHLVDRCDRCGAFLQPMTAEQHAAVEAVYRDLEEQLDWPRGSGLKRTAWHWHQLMVSAFAEENGWEVTFLPSLSGTGSLVPVVRSKQSRLTKKQGSELIEFARAWAVNNGVKLTEYEKAA